MSEKRRDKKGRVLRNGESQQSDGMYMYRYNDTGGVRRTIYSWRLVESDKLPANKRPCQPLRDLEKEIDDDLNDGLQTFLAAKLSVNELCEKYIDLKQDLKLKTKNSYFSILNTWIRGSLGEKKIRTLKYSDIRQFYLSLYNDRKLNPNSIRLINSFLNAVFAFAVKDGYLKSNPVTGVYTELKKQNAWEQEKRHALTKEQQIAFMNFAKYSCVYCKWYSLLVVMLGTGCRIGEALGLRWDDCNFDENVISINHNLIYGKSSPDEPSRFFISTPKTKSGTRVIPMLAEVKEALVKEYEFQEATGFNQTIVDGYSGFIFKNTNGSMINPSAFDSVIRGIINAYNRAESKKANSESREPVLLPHFSAHNLRHTFCTRLCENETNLKVIQEIMGHSNISITMDIYNEATLDQKKASFSNLEGKIILPNF